MCYKSAKKRLDALITYMHSAMKITKKNYKVVCQMFAKKKRKKEKRAS